MIIDVEQSPSNRAMCMKCNKKILLGDLRGVVRNEKYHSYHFLCKSCSINSIDEDIEALTKLKEKFK